MNAETWPDADEIPTPPDPIADAIKGYYHDRDRNTYCRKDEQGVWNTSMRKEDVTTDLKIAGLWTKAGKGERASQTEIALSQIRNRKGIDGVFPAFFCNEDIVDIHGMRYVNTSRAKLFQPAEKSGSWGEGFLKMAAYFDFVFGQVQLPYLLGWLAYFYKSALKGKVVQGQAVFVAGGVDGGKTFFGDAFLQQIFGATGDATKYLTGEDQFNMSLFSSPIWTVNDAVATTDNRSRNKFSQFIKAVVANRKFIMRGMRREGVKLPWNGRVVVSMNDDPESIRMLPSLDLSIKDKIILLKAQSGFKDFPTDEEIAAELSSFCAYLRDYEYQENVWVGGRFGISPYHHPDLIAAAEDASDTQGAEEIIAMWREIHFGPGEDGAKENEWMGTSSELLRDMLNMETLKEIAKKQFKSSSAMGTYLGKIIKGGSPILIKNSRTAQHRSYKIARPGMRFDGSSNLVPDTPDAEVVEDAPEQKSQARPVPHQTNPSVGNGLWSVVDAMRQEARGQQMQGFGKN